MYIWVLKVPGSAHSLTLFWTFLGQETNFSHGGIIKIKQEAALTMRPRLDCVLAISDALEGLESCHHIVFAILETLNVPDLGAPYRRVDGSYSVWQMHRGGQLARKVIQKVIEGQIAVRCNKHLLSFKVAVAIAKEPNTTGLSEVSVAVIRDVTMCLGDAMIGAKLSPSNRRGTRHFSTLQ